MATMFSFSNIINVLRTLLDISILWLLFYFALRLIRSSTRTIQIFKGIMFFLLAKQIAKILGLETLEYLLDLFVNWGFIAIIIVFQPEIRNILEKLGTSNVFSRLTVLSEGEREKLVRELVKACSEMSKAKTGALISIEQKNSLSEFTTTGTPLNSEVSSSLLCTIFQYGTPLHDGAVIIKGTQIESAAVYFPPTTRDLPVEYGARHRAAVGISEVSDCITLVISEESGNISIAENGKLTTFDIKGLHDFLMERICKQQVSYEKNAKILPDEQEDHRVEVDVVKSTKIMSGKDDLNERGQIVPLTIHYEKKSHSKVREHREKK